MHQQLCRTIISQLGINYLQIENWKEEKSKSNKQNHSKSLVWISKTIKLRKGCFFQGKKGEFNMNNFKSWYDCHSNPNSFFFASTNTC